MTLTPAYGRDYKSKKAVEADFRAGKDFVGNAYDGSSGYMSISDFTKGESVTIRYKRNRSVCIIKV